MTIFFYHVSLALFPLAFLSAYLGGRRFISASFLPALFGAAFGALCFSAFARSANADTGKIVFDALALLALLALLFAFRLKRFYLTAAVIFALGCAYGFEYRFIGMNFKIFSGELLDSFSLTNLFMAVLGALALILFYFIYRSALARASRGAKLVSFALAWVFAFIAKIGFLGLDLRQADAPKALAAKGFEGLSNAIGSSEFLSIIAKIIHYNNSYLTLALCLIATLIALLTAFRAPSRVPREADIIKFREVKAGRFAIFRDFSLILSLGILISFLGLYYILVASKPPTIDEPKIIEPQGAEFIIDANIVKDGKLHRFAYVTDDGHKVRFFLLNRFTDKFAPVAVFDACSICGDMGYIKKGDELICIACNVRIFLPSVGKLGGCNPIPLDYKLEGQNIVIALKTIEDGASYFSEIVDKKVIDPVSRKEILNTSKFSYLYYGRTYFFESEANANAFTAHPERYVDENGTLKELK